MLSGVPTFEIRYEMPPHAVGFDRVVCADEFDAEIVGEEKYGDRLVSVREVRAGDVSRVESHDQILRRAGAAPKWLRDIGIAVDSTIDAAIR
jgi:hypothetical protein